MKPTDRKIRAVRVLLGCCLFLLTTEVAIVQNIDSALAKPVGVGVLAVTALLWAWFELQLRCAGKDEGGDDGR